MRNKKAIVSIQIGEPTQREWNDVFRKSWVPYAEKYDYDIIVIDNYIDSSPRAAARAPHWQKLLICEVPEVQQYESVVWLDTDVMINYHTAPCIVSSWSGEKIGIVSERESLRDYPGAKENLYDRYERTLGHYHTLEERYRLSGLGDGVDDYSNTGVFVIDPRRHRDILREIYTTYQENEYSAKEETPFSYHIYKNNLTERIDPRFNRLWYFEIIRNYPACLWPKVRQRPEGVTALAFCVNMAWHNAWFTHFTGDTITAGDDSCRIRDDANLLFVELDDIMKLMLRD
jgi:hypothetical protein